MNSPWSWLRRHFAARDVHATVVEHPDDVLSFRVGEGVEGTHHYHLWFRSPRYALCGARIMRTGIPLSAWGVVTHLRERWCEGCVTTAKTGQKVPT